MEASDLAGRGYGAVLWEPDDKTVRDARVTRFMTWLAGRGTLNPAGYQDLWDWSVTDPAAFWSAVWDYFDVLGDRGEGPDLAGEVMPGIRWFSGATLNYARNALRTAWTDEWEDPANPDPLPMPLQTILTADARARIQRGANKPDSGAGALITYFVGQVVGSLRTVRPARQVVLDMVKEYIEVVERLGKPAD